MKKEIYRSFNGKLDAENRSGYIIYDCGAWYECEGLSVYNDVTNTLVRFLPSDAPSNLSDAAAIGEIIDAVNCGRISGQVFWRGKWYTPRDIMDKYQDVNWRKYCK